VPELHSAHSPRPKDTGFGGLLELMTFECESCGPSHIEEDARPRRVSPQTDISAWYLDEFGNPTREINSRE
jgi:hypothetical protein